MRLTHSSTSYLPITPLCLLVVAAVGAQLMQPRLWPPWAYMALCGTGALCLLVSLRQRLNPKATKGALLLGVALLAFGSTGWRASHYAATILPAHLQERDIVVQGQVMGLPQWLPDGVRFTFAVERATIDNQPVPIPAAISLAWYLPRAYTGTDQQTVTPPPPGQRCAICVSPGERWRLTVRLKQPHGSRNPFGFDYERWLWEQGLGATGYVRAGTNRPTPEKIGQAHPLNVRVWRDRARLHAREAVYQTLLPPTPITTPAAEPQAAHTLRADSTPAANPAARTAGIIAALLMGDQRGILQADWSIFRLTGV